MRNELVVVMGLLLIAPLAWAQAAIDETKAVKADGLVEIQNVAGSVEVVGWDRAEVQVTGTIENNVERVAFDVRDGRTEIEAVIVKGAHNKHEANLTIHVPAASQLRVKTVSASVGISGPEAAETTPDSLRVETVSGGMRVEASAHKAELVSVSGKIGFAGTADAVKCQTISGGIECSGSIGALDANSISGRIMARGVQSETETSTVSGKIAMDVAAIKNAVLSTISGAIELSGSLADAGGIEADTQSGGITVALAGDVSAEVEMKSVSGDLDTNLTAAAQSGPEPGETRALRFTTGSGAGRVKLSSVSGGISVRRLMRDRGFESKSPSVSVSGSVRIRGESGGLSRGGAVGSRIRISTEPGDKSEGVTVGGTIETRGEVHR